MAADFGDPAATVITHTERAERLELVAGLVGATENKWQFRFPGSEKVIHARVEDQQFLSRIRARAQGCFHGDIYRVILRTTKTQRGTEHPTLEYAVLEVLSVDAPERPAPGELFDAG
jgi:hypothetical protein